MARQYQPGRAGAMTVREGRLLDQAVEAISQRDLQRAELLLLEAKKALPKEPEIFNLLGVVALESGNPTAAIPHFRKATKLAPRNAQYQFHLGNALVQKGSPTKAIPCFRHAVEADPEFLEAYTNLGILLSQTKSFDAATDCLAKVLKQKPEDLQAHMNFASVAIKAERNDEALESLRYVAEHKQDGTADFWKEIGAQFCALKAGDDAAPILRKAASLAPTDIDVWKYLGHACEMAKDLDCVIEAVDRVMALAGDDLRQHLWALLTFKRCGLARRAVEAAYGALAMPRKSHGIEVSEMGIRQGMLLEMNYLEDMSTAELFEAHKAYGQCFPPAEDVVFSNGCGTSRRLRIGYVSGDLRKHSVAYFIGPVLRQHDKSRVEIFCYYCHNTRDELTDEFQALADHWRDISKRSTEQALDAIRRDRIDVLVDLSGHTGDSRLEIFAERAAPVQVTWMGYPNTTGLSAMDYRITDAMCDPSGMTEHLHTETLVRLPRVFSVFQPDENAPEPSLPPSRETGQVTFGCFNNYMKLNDQVFAAWGRILARVPDSRLIFKMGKYDYDYVRRYVYQEFQKQGVTADRLVLLTRTADHAEHLATFGQIDIALDPFPYNGTTTTMETLWMGVPVIVLEGEDHRSRVGVSQMVALGLEELIGRDIDDYVDRAVALANDPERMADLRVGMRDRMRASPLMDHAGFTRELEATYQQMWDTWCAQQRPGDDGQPTH